MPVRLDQIDQEQASTAQTPARIPQVSPSIPGLPPGLELQGMTIGRNGRPSSIRLAPPKQAAKPKTLPQGQLTALQSTDRAIVRLKKLIQTQKEKQFKTGPLSPRFYRGTVGNAAMQYVGSPEERVFKAENERFTNDYLTAQTGAQRGFKEMQWLQTAIPNAASDTPENYVTNAESALQDLIENRDRMLQGLEESGFRVPRETMTDQEDDPLGLR